MKLLIYSPTFYPRVGGIETLVSILACEFLKHGYEVKLVCQIGGKDENHSPFPVFRRPGVQQLFKLTRWCDIYFQFNISLKGIWPLLVCPKPWVVSHQTWYTRSNGKFGWQDYLKHFCSKFATNISLSHAMANHLFVPSVVIPNTYRDNVFHRILEISRNKELAFVGRLVSDKGVDLLLTALANLRQEGLSPKLTIVGGGPEEPKLRKRLTELKIENQITFTGVKSGEDLSRLLNAHQILVIPSMWNEPFGIVALEGIACGCVIIGSEGGGLKEAIGPCGITFPNGDAAALTKCLAAMLNNPTLLEKYRQNTDLHLSNYKPEIVARAYEKVFEQAMKARA